MLKTVSEKLRLGIFVLSGVVLFTIGVYLIGNKQSLFGKRFTISSVFNNVNGLKIGNNVRYGGVNVGNVADIEMINDTAIRVVMIMEREVMVHLKSSSVATIGSDGLVGNMVVNIVAGNHNAQMIQDGDQIVALDKVGADEMLSTLSVTNENAALLTAGLLQITNSINEGKGTLGMLVNDPGLATEVRELLVHIKEAAASARNTMQTFERVARGMGSDNSLLGVLTNDTVVANQAKRLLKDLSTSGNEMKGVLSRVDAMVRDMQGGESSVVKALLYDTSLVKNLQETLMNINSGSKKFDDNMEALKHHSLLKGYFRDVEKEKKKK